MDYKYGIHPNDDKQNYSLYCYDLLKSFDTTTLVQPIKNSIKVHTVFEPTNYSLGSSVIFMLLVNSSNLQAKKQR